MDNTCTIDIIIPVFNGASTIVTTISKLLTLPIIDNWQVWIFVVDDGSTDSTVELIEKIKSSRVKKLRLSSNKGRAAARDFGAINSKANYLLFLDSDCIPGSSDYLRAAISELEKGANLIFGPIGSIGSGFWPRYLADVDEKRQKNAENGQWLHAMTSANLLIKRDLYNKSGGFKSEYKHYGFEDRDLIIRLLTTNPHISFSPTMCVLHDSGNTVKNYCSKMEIAAQYSAPRFYRDHLDHYLTMAYGKLDPEVNCSLWLNFIGTVSTIIKWPLVFTANILVLSKILPYRVTKVVVQAASAISFIYGTKKRS